MACHAIAQYATQILASYANEVVPWLHEMQCQQRPTFKKGNSKNHIEANLGDSFGSARHEISLTSNELNRTKGGHHLFDCDKWPSIYR